MTENGIYSPLMKVISNTILLVYSLRGALIKIARGCHTQWRVSMKPPHYWKRSEGILLRSPTPIIANVSATGTRVPTHGLASTYLTHVPSHITEAFAILSIRPS